MRAFFADQESAVLPRVFHVFGSGPISKVVQPTVGSVAVEMAHFLAHSRLADKCASDQNMNFDAMSFSIAPEIQMRIPVAIERGFHDFTGSIPLNGSPFPHIRHETGLASNPSVSGDFVIREGDQFDPNLLTLVAVETDGHADATFCISVEQNNNFFVGDNQAVIASNCRDRDNQEQYDTTAGGSRISTGIPESLGKGGVIRVVDDPHKTDEVESDLVREGVIKAYDEIWRTRENDPNAGAEVIIMQRQAENDLSGHVLEDGDVVHLCLPAEYDPGRHCTTVIGFSDPRTEDGELLWPARFGADWADTQKKRVGEFAWAGQYQQLPAPRGGGVIKKEWWQLWSGEDRQKYPPFEYILATVDTATSIKTEADFSACTVWGLWRDEFETPRVVWRDAAGIAHETRQGFRGAPRLMLIYAWQDRLTLHDLVMRLIETCSRFKVDRLRIEATAAGFAAHQELHRLLSDGCRCAIDLERVPQGMDKYARLLSVQHLFQEGLIYAPEKAWADMVIEQVASFPRGAHDDLVDCTSSAIRYMRDINMALRSQEHTEAESALTRHRGRASTMPLYPV